MQVIFGTKDDILIMNEKNDLMTIRTFEHKWFSGQTTETTVTFPISDLKQINFIEPTPFRKGKVVFVFDDPVTVVSKLHMAVQYKNRKSVARLARDLQNKIDFT